MTDLAMSLSQEDASRISSLWNLPSASRLHELEEWHRFFKPLTYRYCWRSDTADNRRSHWSDPSRPWCHQHTRSNQGIQQRQGVGPGKTEIWTLDTLISFLMGVCHQLHHKLWHADTNMCSQEHREWVNAPSSALARDDDIFTSTRERWQAAHVSSLCHLQVCER